MAHRGPAGLDIEAAGATAARGTVATTQENPRVNVGGWSRAGRAPWMLVRFAGLETSCMTINTSAPLVKDHATGLRRKQERVDVYPRNVTLCRHVYRLASTLSLIMPHISSLCWVPFSTAADDKDENTRLLPNPHDQPHLQPLPCQPVSFFSFSSSFFFSFFSSSFFSFSSSFFYSFSFSSFSFSSPPHHQVTLLPPS
ncbi:unnamed protein product [Arctogadus glacialis]